MDIQEPSQTTDHDLILAATAGDHPAFATLVERYVSAVYKFSYRTCGTAHDAEDVAQETFLRVEKFEEIRPCKKF